jgi:eukaryotic-like serine/threonine-protein kinase
MERLAERYELGDALGQGRSTVYRAVDTRLHRDVAIKRVQLLAGQETPEKVRTRALREAQASARLNNPSVVAVYDVVEEAGAIWLVMELVDGPSLSEVVAGEGPLPHARAAAIGLGVLTALEAAHRVGVVHRDVKPANVMICDGDHAKLTDFGVATIRDESRVTATGSIIGSPSYMSPEQATGREITPATDLWALGATLYFALEGVPPFQAGNALATASAVVHGEPRAAQNTGPLSPLLERLLTKDPSARPRAGEVRGALTRAARSSGGAATPAAGPIPGLVTAGSDAPRPSVSRPTPPPSSSSEATAVHASPVDAPPVDAPPEPASAPADPPTPSDPSEPPAPSEPSDPAEPSEPSTEPSRLPLAVVAAGVGVGLVLALVVAVSALTGDGDGGEQAGAGETPSTTAAAEDTTTTTEPTTTTEATTTTTEETGLPEGWTPFTDPHGAYTLGLPPGWEVRETSNARRLDFVDSSTGSLLRVEWTPTPGPSAAQAWRDNAPGFAANNAGYDEIAIDEVDYRDYDAALWEFRHGSGETMHTGNLGFVTHGRGYAMMLRTPESRWEESQPLFEQFKRAFQPT